MTRWSRSSWAIRVGLACLAALCCTSAQADPSPAHFGVSVSAGVLNGLGLSLGMPVGDHFNLRMAGSGFRITRSIDVSNDNGSSNNFDVTAKLLNYGVLADWHPFKGSFRFTAGAMKNGSELSLNALNNSSDVNVGNCTYTSSTSNPLRVNGATHYRNLAPYAGLGWGGNLNGAPGFFATADVGVLIVGASNITLNASGQAVTKSGPVTECGVPGVTVTNASTDPNVQNQLAKDQRKLNDNVDRFNIFPMISVGIGWRF